MVVRSVPFCSSFLVLFLFLMEAVSVSCCGSVGGGGGAAVSLVALVGTVKSGGGGGEFGVASWQRFNRFKLRFRDQ
ncbi:hypothetical protein P8452_39282 [Trifolium repens]|nr:hypothetical protein P8452_39282 [Trifolium repens]